MALGSEGMRPQPPETVMEPYTERFEPSPEMRDWIIATFIDESGELYNPDHAHLKDASFGVLWTNCDNSRNMRTIIGQAELMPPMAMGKWQRARTIQQIEEWFEQIPDFLLTFHAIAAESMNDTDFCALVEHELYHCAQKLDQYGMPKFGQDGRPSYCIKGHDVEEFIGVVARYGPTPAVAEMIEVASNRPSVMLSDIRSACGTCALKVA